MSKITVIGGKQGFYNPKHNLNIGLMAINKVKNCISDTAYSESCNLVIGEMTRRMVGKPAIGCKKYLKILALTS